MALFLKYIILERIYFLHLSDQLKDSLKEFSIGGIFTHITWNQN